MYLLVNWAQLFWSIALGEARNEKDKARSASRVQESGRWWSNHLVQRRVGSFYSTTLWLHALFNEGIPTDWINLCEFNSSRLQDANLPGAGFTFVGSWGSSLLPEVKPTSPKNGKPTSPPPIVSPRLWQADAKEMEALLAKRKNNPNGSLNLNECLSFASKHFLSFKLAKD